MKGFFVLTFFLLVSCQGNSSNKGPAEVKVSDGSLSSVQEANAYIKESKSQIPSSLQLANSDIETLKQEGLITQEEALELSKIIE